MVAVESLGLAGFQVWEIRGLRVRGPGWVVVPVMRKAAKPAAWFCRVLFRGPGWEARGT